MPEAHKSSLLKEVVETPLLWKFKSRLVALVGSVLEGTCPRKVWAKAFFFVQFL